MTAALTDVSSLVDEAFAQLECAWNDESSHDGSKVAYLDFHGCGEGWICASHYQTFINFMISATALIERGAPCDNCGRVFPSVQSYVSVYTL